MSITVMQVNGDAKGMKDFLEFPYELYRDNSYWCPPLKIERKLFFSDKNPFFDHSQVSFWVAYDGSQVVGRITAHVDDLYNEYHDVQQGFFGFYESIDSPGVAEKLLGTAENWLQDQGINSILGPFNFSSNHEIGFLIEGFESAPKIMMPYTQPYYPSLLNSLGYANFKKLNAYYFYDYSKAVKRLSRFADRIEPKFRKDVEIKKLDRKNLGADLRVIIDIFNDAWKNNWGYVPMTKNEIEFMAKSIKLIADYDFIYILYKNGEPAACFLALPDINEVLKEIGQGTLFPWGIFKFLFKKKYISSGRIVLSGVKRKFQRLGLDLVLYKYFMEMALNQERYKYMEMSWILEDNQLNRFLKSLGAKNYKKYVIMGKEIPSRG